MKNLKFIFAALVSIAALSCNKLESPVENSESNQDEGLVPLVLTTGEATKTHIAANGTDIHWDQGDQIKVFTNVALTGTNGYSYDFSMPENFTPDGKFAKFEGKVALSTSTVWAVYPSELAKNATTSGVLTVNLPASQTAFNGETSSFNKNLNISAAKATVELDYELGDVLTQRPVASETMTFHNVCALLKFNIPAGITNISSVTISTDTDIVGDMTIDYSGNAPVFERITANGSNSITMTKEGTFTADKDYYFVLAPVAISELSIFVNTTDNKQYAATKTFSTPLPLNAGEYKSIGKLNVNNMPSFGVDFDIQDDGGFLNGTDVVFTFPSDNVSNLHLTVSNGTTTVRSIDIDGAVTLDGSNRYISSCLNETVTSWPYLPKGTYTVSGTYETEGGTASVNNGTFVIDTDPNFTVGSFDAYTSYTKYTSGTNTAVADANACDGASIYVTARNVGISENILKNTNYKDLLQVQFVAPASGYGVANLTNGLTATLTNQQYGEYKSPSYVFDGKKLTSDKTCYVTGLPYVLNPAKNDSVNPWEVASTNDSWYVSWTGSALKVGGNSVGQNVGAIKSFYVPEETQIKVTASASGSVTGGRTNANTGSVKLGGSELVSSTAAKGGLLSGTKTVTFSETKAMSISTSNSQLSCSVTYGLSEAHMLVNSLMILYR